MDHPCIKRSVLIARAALGAALIADSRLGHNARFPLHTLGIASVPGSAFVPSGRPVPMAPQQEPWRSSGEQALCELRLCRRRSGIAAASGQPLAGRARFVPSGLIGGRRRNACVASRSGCLCALDVGGRNEARAARRRPCGTPDRSYGHHEPCRTTFGRRHRKRSDREALPGTLSHGWALRWLAACLHQMRGRLSHRYIRCSRPFDCTAEVEDREPR